MNEQTNQTSIDNNVEEKPDSTKETPVEESNQEESQPTSEEEVAIESFETVKSEDEETLAENVADIVANEERVPKQDGAFPDLGEETLKQDDAVPESGEDIPMQPSPSITSDLDEEKEYSQEEFEKMSHMYQETMQDFVEGEVVLGKVLAVSDKEASVDIGFKSEGTIPLEEFPDPSDIVVGDTIEVFLDEIEDKEGQLVLSKKKADFMRIWANINDSYEKGEIIRGKCVRRIKGGIVVDLDGVDAFLPGSQIDVKPIRDFDAIIGKDLEFKVVKINNLRKNIVVSHRVLVEQEVAEVRRQILSDLERGQVLEGTVKNITDFGVFIDLGGVDGLLHINDLSWGRVSHPSEVVALDEKIKVVVLDYNDEKNRISLGLKQLQPHPWEEVEKKFPIDSLVRGKVVSISDYGAFVELEKGVEGLIHISEMSWTQHIKHPSKILSVGEMVEAKVLNIEKDERKISLGLKQLEPDPWESLTTRYPIGSHHSGKVRNLTNFGAFVELEEGIDGLVHISDLSWTKKIRHPGEVIKKGEELEVVILGVDRENRRISLGYKQTMENPWEIFEEKYKPGTLTKGKIVRLIEKGVVVELPLQVEGFVPMSHLDKRGMSKPADEYKLEDEIDLCVIEFSKDNKKIILSEKRAHEKMAVTDMESKTGEAAQALEGEKVEVKAEEEEKPAKESVAEQETPEDVTESEPKADAAEATTVEKEVPTDQPQAEAEQVEEIEEPAPVSEEKESEVDEQVVSSEEIQTEEEKIAKEEAPASEDMIQEEPEKSETEVESKEQAAVQDVKSEEPELTVQDQTTSEKEESSEPVSEEVDLKEEKKEEEESSNTSEETSEQVGEKKKKSKGKSKVPEKEGEPSE